MDTNQTPNEKQSEILDMIRRDVIKLNHSEEHQAEYEIKTWNVNFWENGTIWLTVEVGRIGDEHTMASVLCRERRMITITRKGQVYLHNAVDKRTAKGSMHLRSRRRPIKGYWRAVQGWTC